MVRDRETIKKQQGVVRMDKIPLSVNVDAVKTAEPENFRKK